MRLLVALLPETFSETEWLLKQRTRYGYEAQFTTFCALDDQYLNVSAEQRKRVLAMLETYLFGANTRSASAAWKAGDSLGDEMYSPQTTGILCRLAKSARCVEGRRSALHGIQHAAVHADSHSRRQLEKIVTHISVSDRSQQVRDYASWMLRGGGCGPKPRTIARSKRRGKH